MTRTLKKIICAVDFSACSDAMISYAAEMGCKETELIILHIAPENEQNKGFHGMHLHEFSRYSNILELHGSNIRFALQHGDPAAGILGYAAEQQADMIMLGSHGSTALTRLLVGSTAETVMRQAECPVMVMKTPDNQTKKHGTT
ncbi:universal stress protein [Chlorobium sp. BLA1]|uniref:universal stress protein n=1 Tax=Candidatus Chlorobium masyuteum TaxID=2716876 RepID=UPI001422B513|nr:universal stress protein [Candidatus Chlorobium masyuteum]NHQ59586.1 universal stress protein [Candidatus Chlorobium masyuteum]